MNVKAYLEARKYANKMIPRDVQLKIIKSRLAAVQSKGEEEE